MEIYLLRLFKHNCSPANDDTNVEATPFQGANIYKHLKSFNSEKGKKENSYSWAAGNIFSNFQLTQFSTSYSVIER